MRFDQQLLDNGLQVIGEYSEAAQSVAVGFFVRTGSRDEEPELAGVSHFLEHMLFKGTARRSAEDINREFDEIGAQSNAFTSEENTIYFGAVLPAYQERVIDLLTDMMRPSLDPDDFEMEKQVILEEIALYQDRPEFVVSDLTRETYFGGHPLGNLVLGSTESISALTRDQMVGYWERRYAPDNVVLALTGRYDWQTALAQVEGLTRTWRPGGAGRELVAPQPEPRRRQVPSDRFQQAHLGWAFPGFAAQDEQRWAAQVIAHAVGDERGSRLYWALVHPGLAETAEMAHLAEDGAGFYMAYVCCDADQAPTVVKTLEQVVERVRREGLEAVEVERAQRKLASSYMLQGETPFGRLVPTGLNWIYRRERRSIEEEVDRLLALTADEIRAALQAHPFQPATLVTLGPAAEAGQ